MITEASARLVSKLMILCFIFTLCQLGSEFKSQSLAQTYEEARALTAIANKLKLNTMISGVCEESSSYTGITCDCTSKDDQNNTICHITAVRLSRRGLTGVIPEEVANLTYLNTLDLADNQLTGSIPASLGNLSSLYWLDLSNNLLTGSIPESLKNMKFQVSATVKPITNRDCYRYNSEGRADINVDFKLAFQNSGPALPGSGKVRPPTKTCSITLNIWFQLDLSNNQLSGLIPTTLGNATVSKEISDPYAYKRFMMTKKNDTTLFSSSFSLDFSNNQLTGPIPESFGNLTFTRYLKLHHNFLKGSIPASLGALTYLYELNLGNNGISGTLPKQLGNLTSLEYFLVGSNSITGTLPSSFANLTAMTSFNVAGNLLSGPLPDFIVNWTSISQLSLSRNNFNGSIPAGIFNLSNLQVLEISDVGDSDFQFPLSTNLIGSLTTLILRNCSISGTIPAYIGNMSSLQNLDLSFNKLNGSIPDSLKKVNLSYMSFSNNMLTGTIPYLNWTVMDLSYNNFSKLSFTPSPKIPVNLFACCCNSITCVPETIDATRIMEKYCPRGRPKYHSLFINCGGGQINNMDGNIYDKDNETSLFYMSPKGNWARSTTENTIYGVKCGLSSEALLYDKARSSRVSMRYYGFCLRKGKYSVTLHFAEIVEDKNYTSEKRVFDVYIQGERKLKDFNIMNKTGAPNKVYKQNFTAVNVNDSTLEIHFYSSGQATPDHGPLISAISVTPEYKLEKQLSPLYIALITVASTIVFVLLLLLFAWMMG